MFGVVLGVLQKRHTNVDNYTPLDTASKLYKMFNACHVLRQHKHVVYVAYSKSLYLRFSVFHSQFDFRFGLVNANIVLYTIHAYIHFGVSTQLEFARTFTQFNQFCFCFFLCWFMIYHCCCYLLGANKWRVLAPAHVTTNTCNCFLINSHITININ